MLNQILLMKEEINSQELDFFLRFPIVLHVTSPVEFLSDFCWGKIRSLSSRDDFRYIPSRIYKFNLFWNYFHVSTYKYLTLFRNIDRDIESSPKRWKKFVESECPEREKFPQEWNNKTSFQRLMMMTALRPDRMTYAVM